MTFPSRERITVEEMDNEIRPYFIHYRNQVGVNKALMDLFSLVDHLLREDENAREPLRALQLVSDYVQRRQIVAPISTNIIDFYDPHNAVDPAFAGQNPLAELSRLLASATAATPRLPSSTGHEHVSRSRFAASPGSGLRPSQGESGFYVPPVALSPSNRGKLDLALAFGDMPVPQVYQEQTLPPRAPSRMNATDHRSALIVEVIREKLRSWLRRPDTTALKNWVLKMRNKYQVEEPEWQHIYAPRPSYPITPWLGEQDWSRSQEFEGTVVTRSASNASLDVMPRPFLHGNIQVTQDVVMYRDSLPPARRRSLSASMSRPLPPLPAVRFGSNNSLRNFPGSIDMHTGIPSRDNGKRHRRNSSAPPSQPSFNSGNPDSFINQVSSTTMTIPRRRRASLRERAISAFSKISGRMDSGAPSQSRHMLPPQIDLETRQDPAVPSISIQPPSRPQTLSTTSVVSPYSASISSNLLLTDPSLPGALRSHNRTSRATGSRYTTVQTIPRHKSKASSTGPSKAEKPPSHAETRRDLEDSTKDWLRGMDIRGSLRTIRASPCICQPGLEEDDSGSIFPSIHHGLPTPKSVENRPNLSLKTPAASLHHTIDDGVGDYLARHELNVPPLTSRFSLDSHFMISSELPDDHSVSSCGDIHSVSEATSHEGEFLARLASRRKKPVRSGAPKQAARRHGFGAGKAVAEQADAITTPINEHGAQGRVSSRGKFMVTAECP